MVFGYKTVRLQLILLILMAFPALPAGVTTIGDSGVRLSITPGAYQVGKVTLDGSEWRSVEGLTAGGLRAEGRPDLPLEGYWIGLPDGATATVTVESVEYEDLPGRPVRPLLRETRIASDGSPNFEYFKDESFYRSSAWYPGAIATLGTPSRFRHQWMIPLRVAPFQVVPSTGILRAYKRIDVRIDFVQNPARESRPRELTGGESRWEGMYQGLVVNYDQARGFRSRAPRGNRAVREKAFLLKDEYKLIVEQGGLYRIDFDDLSEEGLSPGEAISSLAVYRRGFSDSLLAAGEDPLTERSLPTRVIDQNGNGLFEDGDAILVYLPGFREDRMKRDNDDRFAYESVYFLSWEGTANPFPAIPGWKDLAGLSPLTSFPDSIRWEIDAVYDFNPPADTTDSYFGMGPISSNRITEVDLPVPDNSIPYAIKAMTVSTQNTNGLSMSHRYVLTEAATGDSVFGATSFGERGELFQADSFQDASNLTEGVNRFTFYGSRWTNPSNPIPGAGGYLDWYEVHAGFLYKAMDDYLVFSTGENRGALQMELNRFGDSSVMVLDITDPYSPVTVTVDSVRQGADGYTIVMQDSVDRSRRYVAATVEGARTLNSSSIVRDAPTELAASAGNYLIITYDDFHDALDDLVEYRESLGHTVRRARISDVYDEFNGGVKDPHAIQNYIRYGYEKWAAPPAFVLLVGDGFEDYKDKATNRGGANDNADDFDYIPAYPEYAPVIYGSGDHWDASDLWYGFLDGDQDALLDVIVGRFPADNSDDVRTMVDKTIAYENFEPTDAWRSRAMFIADDAWTFESNYCMENRYQRQFEENSLQFSENLANSAARGVDTVNIFLSRFTDEFHTAFPCTDPHVPNDENHADVDRVIEESRRVITPRIFEEWNDPGVFLVNFQGHGSRTLLTHEIIMRTSWDYRSNRSDDLDSLTSNAGRPYIFMAYGCSISEFDRWRSQSVDAITEDMMRHTNGGAVATFGSTGIEFLRPNLALNNSILKYLYSTPGVIPGDAEGESPPWFEGVPRWSLGEVVALGLLDFVAVEHENPDVIRRYVLFGDPALVLDGSLPVIDMFVDGEAATDGQVLRGHEDGSPVQLEAFIHDETIIDADSISLFGRAGLLDRSLYSLELDSSLATDGRAWVLRHAVSVDVIDSYDMIVRAVDYNGRIGTFTLTVSVSVEVTFDGERIESGGLVSPHPLVRAVIETPLPVGEDDVLLEIDGRSIKIETLLQEDENTWIATARPALESGSHELIIGISGQTKSFFFRVDTAFRLSDLLNYPNPAENSTGFYYELTDFADQVDLEIFTITGRKIRQFSNLAGRPGYNGNPDLWDGTDQDGDQVAWGVYLYRVTARRGGDKVEAMGKAVLVPPDLPGNTQGADG